MRLVLPWLLLAGLVAHATGHVAIAVGLARRREWGRAALALVVAPLAPWWGWRVGMRAPVIAWAAGLALYALGVALA